MKLLPVVIIAYLRTAVCRDEEKILKACYWANEVYDPCFGGCAEVSCDNPRNHLRPCYPYCEPGCVCEDPYVRDDRTHQCVLPQDCSPTQMGIPVVGRRNSKAVAQKYDTFRRTNHIKRNGEFLDLEQGGQQIGQVIPSNHVDDIAFHPSSLGARVEGSKRASEVSRMGNYFNIVIAPPPIKALQPRKMVSGDTAMYRTQSGKRL